MGHGRGIGGALGAGRTRGGAGPAAGPGFLPQRHFVAARPANKGDRQPALRREERGGAGGGAASACVTGGARAASGKVGAARSGTATRAGRAGKRGAAALDPGKLQARMTTGPAAAQASR